MRFSGGGVVAEFFVISKSLRGSVGEGGVVAGFFRNLQFEKSNFYPTLRSIRG